MEKEALGIRITEMKVEVMNKKLIKPCKSTPTDLKNFKISYVDEIVPAMNVSVILCYSPPPAGVQLNDRLEESLAGILPEFYPLAGRYIKDDHLIDCSDQGAEYIEARVNCKLSELMNGLHDQNLNELLPRDTYAVDNVTDTLLAIQVSKFTCGGLAICISVSHRVFDGTSLETFIVAWTNASRGYDMTELISPIFNSPLLFPRPATRNIINITSADVDSETTTTKAAAAAVTTNPDIVAKKFLFDKTKISRLRAKVTSISNELDKSRQSPISRVKLVSALILKALTYVDHKRHGNFRGLLASQAVNIRERTIPKLPKYSCGNFGVLSLTQFTAKECENLEYHELVRFQGDNIIKTLEACAQVLSQDVENRYDLFNIARESMDGLRMSDINVVAFTDWSKFKFYEADFGWGEPTWTSVGNAEIKNLVVLMGCKDGEGIEAWVHLDQRDTYYFEEEIKGFTS